VPSSCGNWKLGKRPKYKGIIFGENVQTMMVDFDHATNMFDGLNTEYKQKKYFKQSGFYIEPETFEIGNCRLNSQRIDSNINLIPKKSTGQHIPVCARCFRNSLSFWMYSIKQLLMQIMLRTILT
jgi:hypothetical protein